MNKRKVLSLVLSTLLLMPGSVYAKENKDIHGKPAMEQKASEMVKASTDGQKRDSQVEAAVKPEASAASSEKGKGSEHKQEAAQSRDEKRAQIEAFKTAMKEKHAEMKNLRQQTIALRQTVEQKTEQLASIINDLQSGKKTLPEDMLSSLLAVAQNLKIDEAQIEETAAISAEAKDTQERVKGADFNNALASMDKVIAKYEKRLAALTQLDTDLNTALEIANKAVAPAPADATTIPGDQNQSTAPTDTQSTTTTVDSTKTETSPAISTEQTEPADTSDAATVTTQQK